MPSSLRFRIAVIALMGAFLIPVGLSSLRGLTHILTCEANAETPFTLIISEDGPPQVISAQKIQADDEALCGGLSLLIEAGGGSSRETVRILVSITNDTEDPWRGTVSLDLAGVGLIPVDIGSVAPGETEADSLDLNLSTGSHELGGSLLIGP